MQLPPIRADAIVMLALVLLHASLDGVEALEDLVQAMIVHVTLLGQQATIPCGDNPIATAAATSREVGDFLLRVG
jgi:hypothetical protein